MKEHIKTMKKFRVEIEGLNFVAEMIIHRTKMSMMASVYVEAENQEKAEKKVLDLVKQQISEDKSSIYNPDNAVFYIREIMEVKSFDHEPDKIGNFIWYCENMWCSENEE